MGAQRARDGHPTPLKLRYVEVGNEDWFDRSGSYGRAFRAILRRHQSQISGPANHRHRKGE